MREKQWLRIPLVHNIPCLSLDFFQRGHILIAGIEMQLRRMAGFFPIEGMLH